jgi:hypothetical protein
LKEKKYILKYHAANSLEIAGVGHGKVRDRAVPANTMKIQVVVEAQHHSFLTSALDGGK